MHQRLEYYYAQYVFMAPPRMASIFNLRHLIGILAFASFINVTYSYIAPCTSSFSCRQNEICNLITHLCICDSNHILDPLYDYCRRKTCNETCGNASMCYLDDYGYFMCDIPWPDPMPFIIVGMIFVFALLATVLYYCRKYRLCWRSVDEEEEPIHQDEQFEYRNRYRNQSSRSSLRLDRSHPIWAVSSPQLDCHYDLPPTYTEAMALPIPV